MSITSSQFKSGLYVILLAKLLNKSILPKIIFAEKHYVYVGSVYIMHTDHSIMVLSNYVHNVTNVYKLFLIKFHSNQNDFFQQRLLLYMYSYSTYGLRILYLYIYI